jgi:homoserine O-acetyltransferase
MVHARKRLIDHLGISRLFCIAGGSRGGFQVLERYLRYLRLGNFEAEDIPLAF